MHAIIRARELFPDGYAITYEDGQRLFKEITVHLASGEQVEVNFENINVTTAGFFNAAFGQLYRDYSRKFLNSYVLPPTGLNFWQQDVLRLCLKNARNFYDRAQESAS